MLVQEAQHSLLMSTQLLGQRFTTALSDVSDDALVLAQLPSCARVSSGDNQDGAPRARLEQVFYSFMRNHPEYLQVRLIARGDFGLERIRVDRDAHGIVVLPDSALQEKGQFSYVFDTLATAPGHIYLSPIVINHETGRTRPKGCRSCAWAHRSSTRRARRWGARRRRRAVARVRPARTRSAGRLHGVPRERVGRFPRASRSDADVRLRSRPARADAGPLRRHACAVRQCARKRYPQWLADPPRRRARCSRSCARRSGTTRATASSCSGWGVRWRMCCRRRACLASGSSGWCWCRA